MRALITGGSGFIGSHLSQYLVNAGHSVAVLDNGSNSVGTIIAHKGNYSAFKSSVANIDTLARAMSGVDIVYHLAARGDYSAHYRHIIRLAQTNVEGTANVIAMARKLGVPKIVFTSSGEVYGNVIGARETDNPNPASLYGASCLAAEALLRGTYAQQGMEVVILRLFSVWGAKDRSEVTHYQQSYAKITGEGTQTRDYVHVSDVIKALAAAYEWDSAIYNLGTGTEISSSGLWKMVRDDKPVFSTLEVDGTYRMCADCEHIKKTVGWEPTVFLSDLSRDDIVSYTNSSDNSSIVSKIV